MDFYISVLLDCPFNPMVDCDHLNISVAPLTSRLFYTCTLFLFRPASLAARPTSVRLSPHLCLFIPSPPSIHPSIFCPVQTSAPVVSCHHHACIPTSVCLSTCRTPAGANLPACLHTCMYLVVHFVTWLTVAQKPCWSSERVKPSLMYDSASEFSSLFQIFDCICESPRGRNPSSSLWM